jgi:hypothetical protein
MAAFLAGLGSGALQYAKQRAMSSPVGRAISGGVSRYRGQNPETVAAGAQQAQDSLEQSGALGGMPPPNADQTAMSMDPTTGSGELAGLSPLAHGRIVTQPTKALLGERGPEAVVPLNPNPQNRVTPAILDSLTPRYRGGDKLHLRVPHAR